MTTPDAIVFLLLGLLPLVLTVTMILSRQMILGFPCLIFWSILGGFAYNQSTTTWDIYYLLFFASAFGMTVFSVMAMYGLREEKDTAGEEEGFIDEKKDTSRYIDEESEGDGMSKRTKGIRDRAKRRRGEKG